MVRSRVVAALWLVAVTVLLLVVPGGLHAATAECAVAINGTLLSGTHDQAPIVIDVDEPIQIEAVAPGATQVAVVARAGFLSLELLRLTNLGGGQWAGEESVQDWAPVATGLYEVAVTTDTCESTGWIRLTGRSPLSTATGLASAAILVAGAVVVLVSVLRAFQGKGSLLTAVIGGAITGLGLLLFQQQSGTAALTTQAAVSWTVLPGMIGGVVQTVAGAAGQGLPTPVGTTTTTTAEPPTTGAEPPTTGAVPPTAGGELPTTGAEPPTAGGELPTTGAEPPTTAVEPPTTAAMPPTTAAMPPPSSVPPQVPPATEPRSTAAQPLPTAEPPATEVGEPPRTSYARLDCPDAVVAEETFELVVGLAASPDSRVVAEPLRRPDSATGPYTMTVQVIADGMALGPGETWRQDLPVTAQAPYPSVTLHLTPPAQAEPVRPVSIRAMYSVDGHPIGLAIRSVAIVRSPDLLAGAPVEPAPVGVDLGLPAGEVAPDLTVRIERADSQSSGRLLVQLLAADPTIAVPDAPVSIDIGADPAADLRRIITQMNQVEGLPTQYVSLRGIGLTIADQLPVEFWDVLRAIAATLPDRPPMVLFLSAEPYVPWELAVVDPPLDPAAPPFLSAQANVGRWVLGHRRPKLPPPAALDVSSLAVVSGVYESAGWERLLEAEAEAAALVAQHGAAPVNATTPEVLELLQGQPAAEVIHFAVHGNFDAEGVENGLILVDGLALDPLAVKGTPIAGSPFVFLNACQVGRGNQVLGDAAGMAEAFLFAGAAGVIAPLWSIDDAIAREIAVAFYDRALTGEMAGAILREARAAFTDAPETRSSTWVAYQYYGHPALRLVRPGA